MIAGKSRRIFVYLLAVSAAILGADFTRAEAKPSVDASSENATEAEIKDWTERAEQGDPDAQFNLAQAYKLGRGVEQDLTKAEALYEQAAAKGHLSAADNYGLLLFQRGERAKAFPYIHAAAGRGDPRAQYILGVSLFNGENVPRDWVRAYALVSLASQAGLTQAATALAQMDEYIPFELRQQGVLLEAELSQQAAINRASQLAAVNLGSQIVSPENPPDSTPSESPALAAVANSDSGPADAGTDFVEPQAPVATPPPPTETLEVPPASEPEPAPEPESASAPFPESSSEPEPTPVSEPEPVPAPEPAPAAEPSLAFAPEPSLASAPNPETELTPATEPEPAPQPTHENAGQGPWRAQLGAFRVAGNADRLWSKLSTRPELSGKQKLLVPEGRLTKLQAGGFASLAEAAAACAQLRADGFVCLAVKD